MRTYPPGNFISSPDTIVKSNESTSRPVPVRNDSAAGYCDLSTGCSYICLLAASYTLITVPSETTRLSFGSSYNQFILPGLAKVTRPCELFSWLYALTRNVCWNSLLKVFDLS